MWRTLLPRALVLGLGLLIVPLALRGADEQKTEKKAEDKKDEKRQGTVTGIVTDKGDNFIEVKADGEEKGRKYYPHWRGGNPDKGGGLDKEIVKQIKDVPLKSRVRIEWSFEERPRVDKIEVLKRGDGKDAETGKEKEKPKNQDKQ